MKVMKIIDWKHLKRLNNIRADKIIYISEYKRSTWRLKEFIVTVNNTQFLVENAPFDKIPKRCTNPVLYNRLQYENVNIDNFFESLSMRSVSMRRITKKIKE